MAKVAWASTAHKRRKKLLKQAKGNRGARRTQLGKAKETVIRGMVYSTRDRKVRKRTFRNLWVIRLNAAARARGLTYGRLMNALKKSNVHLDRKQLAELAINEQDTFDRLVEEVTVK